MGVAIRIFSCNGTVVTRNKSINIHRNLPGLGTSLVDVDDSGSTSGTRKTTGSMKQLGRVKRRKSQLTDGDVETPSSTK